MRMKMRVKKKKKNDRNYDEVDDQMLQDEMGVDRSKWLKGDSYS